MNQAGGDEQEVTEQMKRQKKGGARGVPKEMTRDQAPKEETDWQSRFCNSIINPGRGLK